jgi:hypothetical protein
MDKTLFEELVGSLKEAKAIAEGRAKPSRRFEVTAPDASPSLSTFGPFPDLVGR